jgi:hypothetical protein
MKMDTQNHFSRFTYLTAEVNRLIREVAVPMKADPKYLETLEQVAREFVANLTPDAIHCFNGRLERGLELARTNAVSQDSRTNNNRRYQVRSSDGSSHYLVDLDRKTCECPDSLKGHTCKHRIAAYYFEQVQKRMENGSKETSIPKKTPEKPTCSIPPQKEPVVKPTCSIQPTRAEFVQAEKRAEKDKPAPVQPPARIEAQILTQLGFAPEKPKVKEDGPQPQLGTLYQRYLHGTDLGCQSLEVTIQAVTKEKVTPLPGQPGYEKWCLWVTGLPENMPTGILFGARGERDLLAIYGRISLKSLIGKVLTIYPEMLIIAGEPRVSIRFRNPHEVRDEHH